jgi:NADH:ubiquinone oxidoreductase subunit 6 (subunit J)
MIVPLTFAALATLAVAGGVGLLLFHKVRHCVLALLVSNAAIAGLHLLLGLTFVAVTQAVVHIALVALLLSAVVDNQETGPASRATLWLLVVPALFIAVASWSIVRGETNPPSLALPPVWAAGTVYVQALGGKLASDYLVPLALLGLLLLTGVTSIHYYMRSRDP